MHYVAVYLLVAWEETSHALLSVFPFLLGLLQLYKTASSNNRLTITLQASIDGLLFKNQTLYK